MSDDQGPNMELRAFVAVVLSLAVMIGYQYFFAPAPPEPGAEMVIEEPVEVPQDEAAITPPAPDEEQVPADGEEHEPATIEAISADVPTAGSHYSFGERRPIEFGHLLPGNSALSCIMFGLARDTRDHQVLPSEGSMTDFTVELSTEVIGSDYDYSKFTLSHDTYFPLGKGHSIRLGLFGGLILGVSPFYNQFFVGDYSAFIPSRLLELNFSHLQPSLLNTSVQEMRYEDMVGSLNLEYSIPFYRGAGLIYGINGFVGAGIFAIASKKDLRTDPKGYQGYEVVPMDLTFDLGVRIDTKIGVLIISMSNLFRLIPNLGSDVAK